MKLLIMAQTPEALVLVVGGVRVVRGGRKRVSQSQPQLEYGRQRDLQPHFLRHQLIVREFAGKDRKLN
jgi:hypothetical protein